MIESFSAFLRALGHRLLPLAGDQPLGRLERARPEVQELAMLLACLATPSCLEAQKTASSRSREHDPWVTVGDPWQSKKNDAEVASPTTSCIQYVTVEKVVENSVEMPSAQPKLSSEASTNTDVLDPVAVDAADVSAQRDALPEFKDAASPREFAQLSDCDGMMIKCQKLLEDTRRQEEQKQPSIILFEACTQTDQCPLGVEVEMQTDAFPSFPAVMDEVNKLEELLDAASRREGSLEEIFRRSYKIVGVDLGIHSVRTTKAVTNV